VLPLTSPKSEPEERAFSRSKFKHDYIFHNYFGAQK